MEELIALLSDIVSAEYAQWMRYTYLSSLGYGLNTDALSEHFRDHGSDELEHAECISRWLVDLGGYPPTDHEPVEQFCGSTTQAIEWLIEYEVSGIKKYNHAYELACTLNIPGLKYDIGKIVSKEHEHLSDLMNMVAPHIIDNSTVVIVARHNPKLASSMLINQKIAVSMSEAINWLQTALSPYYHDYKDDPNETKQIALELIEGQVTDVWNMQEFQGKQQYLRGLKELYQMVQSADEQQWLDTHNIIFPRSEEPEQQVPSTFEDIMQHIEPPEQVTMEDVENDDNTHVIQQQETPVVEEERPIEQVLEFKVFEPGKSRRPGAEPTKEVNVGDKIKNMTLTGPGVPNPGRPGRASWNEGEIIEIISPKQVKVLTPKGEQVWDSRQDKLELDLKSVR